MTNIDRHHLPPHFPDLTVRPPTIPAAIGSDLFPLESLNFTEDLPIATQMRVSSLKRRRYESYNFYLRKHPQHAEFRDYNCGNFNYCGTCSEFVTSSRDEMTVVIHKHYSSMSYCIQSDHGQSVWAEFFCPTCKVGFHGYKSGTRYPVLVTSSILANWQGVRSMNGYPGDDIHVDQLSVPGATIKDLQHAFLAVYSR